MTDIDPKTLGQKNVARGFSYEEPLIFEHSRPGRIGFSLPEADVPLVDASASIPAEDLRTHATDLPEVSEVEVIRHFTRLSTWNAAVDLGLYPLGSCTMKYNPRVNEKTAALPGFAQAHPLQPPELSQGFLELAWKLEQHLCEVSGMDRVSLQPAAGAQGELAGIMMIRAYHDRKGERRSKVLVPDSAHGTNPASAALNDYEVITVPSGDDGILHPEAVEAVMTSDVAALMVTNPNTLGLFEEHIDRITTIVPRKGRPRIRGRSQSECDAGRRPTWRPRCRRDALQPSQDFLNASWWRRTGLRACRVQEYPRTSPPDPRHRAQ